MFHRNSGSSNFVCMGEELVDYSSNLMDATQIWANDPHQQLEMHTPVDPLVSDIQVDAYILEMEDVVATINDLGFIQPNPIATSEYIHSLQEDQRQPVLKIFSPSKL